MKKFVMILLLAVFSVGAHAQIVQGKSSIGFNAGYAFDSENATLGIDYRYCITDEVRLNPSLIYFVKNDGLSAWAIDLNAHYVIALNDIFAFYPLAGVDLSFWKFDWGGSVAGYSYEFDDTETRLGVNVGIGAELYATDELSIGLEVKYNIIKDIDQVLLGFRVGYCF